MHGNPAATPVDLATAADDAATPDGSVALRIKDVVRETRDAVSIVFDIPDDSASRFGYRAGQFLTLLVCVEGQELRRCYSMSSSPAADEDLQITIKRDGHGVVSNWLNDIPAPGDSLCALPPQGRFVLSDSNRPLIMFAGGSGITPVFSLVRSALLSTTRTTRLFYANRNRGSVIFDESLACLTAKYAERCVVHHHLDDERGIVSREHINDFIQDADDAEFYICGPNAFMDAVQATLGAAGVPSGRVHVERFTISEAALNPPDSIDAVPDAITIVMGRRTTTAPHAAGNTVLQTARMAGLRAPSSCEIGSCGTCMARLTHGSVRMLNNDALDEDEVNDGWILTCQAMPTSSTMRVEYE
jgi:ferredoxin-NADP reductase